MSKYSLLLDEDPYTQCFVMSREQAQEIVQMWVDINKKYPTLSTWGTPYTESDSINGHC
jgi:hypothetical protein